VTSRFASEWRTPDAEYKAPDVEVFAFDNVVTPDALNVVKAPVPAVVAPIEVKLAAPAPVIFQFASFKARSEPVDAPIVMVPPAEFPIVVFAVPELFINVVPATVTPAFNVCNPVHVFACPNAREATTAPVVGDMVNVPSALDIEVTPPLPGHVPQLGSAPAPPEVKQSPEVPGVRDVIALVP
jgi:hypothetical protein